MGKFTAWSFLGEQFTRLPPPLYADLEGKTVLVIGANAGIGLEAAKHFAKMKPARLIVGCRSEERGRAAVEGGFQWALYNPLYHLSFFIYPYEREHGLLIF